MIYVEPIILPLIQEFPRMLMTVARKLPYIGFFDHSSIICLWDKEECAYKLLETWNGKFKITNC